MVNYKQLNTGLLKEYRKLAKRADQRLVRLEALSYEKGYEGVLSYAYKRAIRDIKSWGGDKRFNIAPPKNNKALEAKIEDIKHFLSAPTSTRKGITKVYKTQVNTLNKKFDLDLSWQQFNKVTQAGLLDSTTFGYMTIFETIAEISRKKAEFEEAIKEANEKHIDIIKTSIYKDMDLDIEIDITIKNILKESGLKITDLI